MDIEQSKIVGDIGLDSRASNTLSFNGVDMSTKILYQNTGDAQNSYLLDETCWTTNCVRNFATTYNSACDSYYWPSVSPSADDQAGEPKQPAFEILPYRRQQTAQIHQESSNPAWKRKGRLDGLDQGGTATIIVDRNCRILHASARAEQILRKGDVLKVMVGRLICTTPPASGNLASLIRDAADVAIAEDRFGGSMAIMRADKLPLTLLVTPARPARDDFGRSVPAAFVYIRDPEVLAMSASVLRDLFGLTSTEAVIALSLARGNTVEQIALQRMISLNTARTHVKGILAKTATNRQAQLVALLLQCVATLRSVT